MTLDDSVADGLKHINTRIEVINELWQKKKLITLEESNDWNAYVAYYDNECAVVSAGNGRHTTIRTHQNVIDIAKELENGGTKSDLKKALIALDTKNRTKKTMEIMAEGSIRLGVRLVAMVDVGPICQEPNRLPAYTPLSWSDERHDLKTLLSNHFQEGTAVSDSSKIGSLFNVLNIRRYTGLKIRWTDNLANHLRLVDDDTTLCIFHHVTFLKHQGQDRQVVRLYYEVRH